MGNNQLKLILIYTSILFALLGPLSSIFPLGLVKDLRFLSPVLVLPLFLLKTSPEKKEVFNFYSKLLFIFTLATIYTIILALFEYESGFTYRNFVNIALTFTPLIFTWGIVKYASKALISKILLYLFWIFTALYFIQVGKDGVSMSDFLRVFESNLITESYYETESGISLIMGFYFLFFLHTKRYKLALFAILLTILGAKRVAIFGVFICTAFYYLLPIHKVTRSRRFYGLAFMAAGLVIAIFWDGIITGSYNTLIQDLTGISPNQFFMGRLNRFQILFSSIGAEPIWGLGLGLGYMENILYYKVNFASAFHGDFYRLFLEFGWIVFAWWLFVIGKFSSKNKLAFAGTLLLILLMQTDNAFIYNRVMFSYYFLMAYAIMEANHE